MITYAIIHFQLIKIFINVTVILKIGGFMHNSSVKGFIMQLIQFEVRNVKKETFIIIY